MVFIFFVWIAMLMQSISGPEIGHLSAALKRREARFTHPSEPGVMHDHTCSPKWTVMVER